MFRALYVNFYSFYLESNMICRIIIKILYHLLLYQSCWIIIIKISYKVVFIVLKINKL